MGACRREIESLEKKTSAPSPAHGRRRLFPGSEVRQRLAGMTPEDREYAIAAALKDGDDAALGAVLGGFADVERH